MSQTISQAKLSYTAKRKYFPDPNQANDGIVAMGDHLSTAILLEAYSHGIFPWPHEDLPLLWFSPDPRGVLDFKDLHISKSLKKFLKKADEKYFVTFNKSFEQVMQKCSEVPRPGQGGTWINSALKKAYFQFHKDGYAHSVEVWRRPPGTVKAGHELSAQFSKQNLVAGLYGVYVGGVFSGESMFFTESNTSKLALIKLIERLKRSGLSWMDTQMVTPVTEALGGHYISRDAYFDKVKKTRAALLEQPLAFD